MTNALLFNATCTFCNETVSSTKLHFISPEKSACEKCAAKMGPSAVSAPLLAETAQSTEVPINDADKQAIKTVAVGVATGALGVTVGVVMGILAVLAVLAVMILWFLSELSRSMYG